MLSNYYDAVVLLFMIVHYMYTKSNDLYALQMMKCRILGCTCTCVLHFVLSIIIALKTSLYMWISAIIIV